MKEYYVAIIADGDRDDEITTGFVIVGINPRIGDRVIIEAQDENGMLIEKTGIVVEVL